MRASVKFESIESNENGLVNNQLDPSTRHDLVQLQVPQKLNLYPTLTSNKYTIKIQFSSLLKNTSFDKKIKFKMGVSELWLGYEKKLETVIESETKILVEGAIN